MTLGGGPVLNRGPNINPVLGGELIATARSLRIPHQILAEPRATSTDANVIQMARGGVATALVRIPNRYMHTPVEVISLTDLDLAVKLIAAYLTKLPRQKDFRP
jgi:tetrahedral aminopeptidase